MRKIIVVAISLIIPFSGCWNAEKINKKNILEQYAISTVWNPDQGDGTYKNPVIYADYSDPDICRAGDDYYMTASSFNCVPALPILHSKDLVNWTLVGYAMDLLEPFEHFSKPQHGNGVYAPSIRFHNGMFYIYYGDPDFGIYMLKTTDPLGKWDLPVLVKPGKGMIDPCPIWDNDKVYLVHAYAASRSGIKSVLVVNELNKEGTAVVNNDVLVFDGHAAHPVIEGAKFYKRNDYYYIFAPAGGVKTGWQTVLRSKNIYGPYEDKIVLHQGATEVNGPHQGAWVDHKSGESWFLHFQDLETYGRVVHLQPLSWIDDWPVIGNDPGRSGTGEPFLTHAKPEHEQKLHVQRAMDSDEFNNSKIGLQWQWHGNPNHYWAFPSTGLGVLRLNCIRLPEDYNNMWDLPNLLLQKFAAPQFTATVRLTFHSHPEYGDSDKAGLLIMGNDYAYIAVEKVNGQMILSQAECLNARSKNPETINLESSIDTNELFFRVHVDQKAQCNFSYSTNGKQFHLFGKSFAAKPGRWIGAKIGMFAVRKGNTPDNGYADLDWFRIEQ